MLETLKKTTEEFTFTVISDHGMTPLTQTADLKAKVEQLGLEFGRDYAACYDSTLFPRLVFHQGCQTENHECGQ